MTALTQSSAITLPPFRYTTEKLRLAVAYVGAKVQQRPIAVAAAAGGLGLFLARRPIGALLCRLYVRFRDRDIDPQDIDNSETDDG